MPVGAQRSSGKECFGCSGWAARGCLRYWWEDIGRVLGVSPGEEWQAWWVRRHRDGDGLHRYWSGSERLPGRCTGRSRCLPAAPVGRVHQDGDAFASAHGEVREAVPVEVAHGYGQENEADKVSQPGLESP